MEQPSAQETLDNLQIPGQAPKPSPEGARKKPPAKEVSAPLADSLKAAKEKFEEVLERQRAPKGKKAPPKEVVLEAEEDDEEAPPKGAEAHAPVKASGEKPQELTGLRQRLALAGIPRKAIDNLSDDDVAQAWKKQEERESAKDAAIQRAADLEKQLGTKATTKPEPQAGVPTEDVDLDEVVSELSAQFGEEESKALASVFDRLVRPLREENAAIKAVLQAARDKGLQDISAKNRARIGEKLSLLKGNDEAWKVLHDLAVKDSEKSPTKHASPDGYFDDAFERVYGGIAELLAAKEPDPQKDSEAKEKARAAASAPTVPSSQKRNRAVTEVDASRAAFRHLMRHPGDTEGAKRSYANMNIQ